jgi:phosphatidylethanolamine-binding protein (PEBP) family uncharacterized protein
MQIILNTTNGYIQIPNNTEIDFSEIQSTNPFVTFDTMPNTYYTLIMVDPDAPSPKCAHYRWVLHWLVVNITNFKNMDGDVVANFMSPNPPAGSGLHRYEFYIFKQKSKLNVDKITDRHSFNFNNFVSVYSLGKSIAKTMFKTSRSAYKKNYCENINGGFMYEQFIPCKPFTPFRKLKKYKLMMADAETIKY